MLDLQSLMSTAPALLSARIMSEDVAGVNQMSAEYQSLLYDIYICSPFLKEGPMGRLKTKNTIKMQTTSRPCDHDCGAVSSTLLGAVSDTKQCDSDQSTFHRFFYFAYE